MEVLYIQWKFWKKVLTIGNTAAYNNQAAAEIISSWKTSYESPKSHVPPTKTTITKPWWKTDLIYESFTRLNGEKEGGSKEREWSVLH